MLEVRNEDILNQTRGLIVHGTNCSGGFGSGIAGQILKRFPIVRAYFGNVPHGEESLGILQIVPITDDLYIANAFTQHKFGGDGKRYASPEAVYKALEKAFKWTSMMDLPLLLPKIGCGLGGLSWEDDVQPIYEELAHKYPDVELHIFEFNK